MSNKATKPKKFCRIGVYLQHKYPILHQNIQDLCLGGLLSTGRGRSVTFIVPDKKTQSKINKLVGSDPAEAVRLLKCHTITQQVTNLSDFSDGLPCANGKVIKATNVTSTHAELSNKVKITKDKDYVKLYPDSRDEVLMASGEVSVSNESSSSTKKKGGNYRTQQSYSGGRDSDQKLFQTYDSKLKQVCNSRNESLRLMNIALLDLDMSNKMGSYNKYHYLSATASLHNFLNESGHEQLCTLLSNLGVYGPFSSITIMQLLDDDTMAQWLGSQRDYKKQKVLTDVMGRNGKLGVSFLGHKTSEYIRGTLRLNRTNICKVMIDDVTKFLYDEEKSGNINRNVIRKYWGTNDTDCFDHLACFLLVDAEVNYVFGRRYVNHKLNNNLTKDELKNINDALDLHILRGGLCSNGRCDWSTNLFLFSQKVMDAVGSKEMFCMCLRVWLDTCLLSPGFDSTENLSGSTVSVQKKSIQLGGDVSPNSLSLTSNDGNLRKLIVAMGD